MKTEQITALCKTKSSIKFYVIFFMKKNKKDIECEARLICKHPNEREIGISSISIEGLTLDTKITDLIFNDEIRVKIENALNIRMSPA